MGKEVKLLGFWASPFVMRTRIALNIKSIDYDYIEENLHAKSELFLQSNPVNKKVPVLLHNDKPVCESYITVEYIDEVFSSGPSILPSDPYDRAIQRFWAAYIDDKFKSSLGGVIEPQSEETRAAAYEQVKEELAVLEDAFVKCSKGKPFFNGDNIGYLDIALGSCVMWLRVPEKMYNDELLSQEKTPNLLAWAERFCAEDVVKDCMPDFEKLMEFAYKIKANFQAKIAAASNIS